MLVLYLVCFVCHDWTRKKKLGKNTNRTLTLPGPLAPPSSVSETRNNNRSPRRYVSRARMAPIPPRLAPRLAVLTCSLGVGRCRRVVVIYIGLMPFTSHAHDMHRKLRANASLKFTRREETGAPFEIPEAGYHHRPPPSGLVQYLAPTHTQIHDSEKHRGTTSRQLSHPCAAAAVAARSTLPDILV